VASFRATTDRRRWPHKRTAREARQRFLLAALTTAATAAPATTTAGAIVVVVKKVAVAVAARAILVVVDVPGNGKRKELSEFVGRKEARGAAERRPRAAP